MYGSANCKQAREMRKQWQARYHYEEEPPELELLDAGDLLGHGVAAAGQHPGGDGLGAERVLGELSHVRLPRHRRHLRHRARRDGSDRGAFLRTNQLLLDLLPPPTQTPARAAC